METGVTFALTIVLFSIIHRQKLLIQFKPTTLLASSKIQHYDLAFLGKIK